MMRAMKKRFHDEGPSRRAALRRLGLAAGGIALSGYAVGCEDDTETAPGESGGDAGAMDAGAEADTGQGPDAAPEVDAGESAPDLQPVRGDGSHPFDYIDTLIIVQMENRSFDHMFGSLSLLEGRDDVDGLREGMSNDAPDGTPVPIHPLTGRYVIDPDPPHGHGPSVNAFNDGANDGFVRSQMASHPDADDTERADVMGYYTRADLPVSYALADAYTLCQNWHCGALAPTWPNRFFSHCATSEGHLRNNESVGAPTPYTALVEAGGTWASYFNNLYFTLLIEQHRRDLGRKADEFFSDAAAGTLPNVSIVEPAFFVNDDHPPSDVRMGQAFLATVYEAVRRSPQWSRCLMLVFYDEHGGFFDHVPPPLAQGETRPDEGFAHVGFRVPGLVIGPLAKRGHVLDAMVEHSSVPALVSRVFGLPFVNERSEMAGDLGQALTLDHVRGADRPTAPALETAEVPMSALEHALRADNGQPELMEWMRRMGLAHHDSLPERRRVLRRVLEEGKALGAIKFSRG